MLYYIIPTSVKYKDVVLQKLLKSLSGATNPIIVIVNQADEQRMSVCNNVTYYEHPYCSYEYSAPLVALKLLSREDFFFWFHDTCEVGKDFNRIVNQFPYQNFDFVDVYNGYCNFGIYSYTAVGG